MTTYHQPLLPGGIYHLFSRAVGSEKLFRSEENYLFFLRKLKYHTSGVCRFYCYALLPNHFHLLAKINDKETILNHFREIKKVSFNQEKHNLSDFIMERFSNFLNSYTKAFNKMYKRKGALFMDYLRRNKAEENEIFITFAWYIHKNPVHHRITKAIGEWSYDSYKSILSKAPTSLLRNEVIDRFGGREAFIEFHQQEIFPKGANLYPVDF